MHISLGGCFCKIYTVCSSVCACPGVCVVQGTCNWIRRHAFISVMETSRRVGLSEGEGKGRGVTLRGI